MSNLGQSGARPYSFREPRPGSDEAIAQGCKCPVIDNEHGRGYMGGARDPETGEIAYVVSQLCPLHWQEIDDV